MIDETLSCETYQARGYTHEVIRANRDHAGLEDGDLDVKPYIVQFNIGVYRNIKEKVEATSRKGEPCISGEQCLEIIVKSSSGVSGGCIGKRGKGCFGSGHAKDFVETRCCECPF